MLLLLESDGAAPRSRGSCGKDRSARARRRRSAQSGAARKPRRPRRRPPLRPRFPAHRSPRATTTPMSWCSGPARAATPRLSAQPTSGKKVVLIERYADLGGVCLNVGCIPSKALLHAARVLSEAEEMSPLRPQVRQAGDRSGTRCGPGKRTSWRKAPRGFRDSPSSARYRWCTGAAKFTSPAPRRGGDGGRHEERFLRHLHHRGRLAGRPDPRLPV